MCGIAAIFAYHSDAPGVDEGELTTVRDRMSARGPDGFGNWFDPRRRVGLGHRRLSIIDLSAAGAQPMLWPERQLAITFNGEIYNYRALRTQLETRGHVFRSGSDTEVLLHLYAEHGEAMVNELRGMYTFALWDGAKRGLFLARDPFGIKPLYLADDGRTLRVASQVKALLAGGQVDTTPDAAGHAGFFLWGHIPDPFTLYRGIRAQPAGHSLWLDESGSRREKRFCSIPEIFRTAEGSLLRVGRGEGGRRPDEVSVGEGQGVKVSGEVSKSALPAANSLLSASLRDAVAHHLIADVPVGVFLSSGLDSTTLAALAAEQGGTLRTVTLGFEEFRGTPDDETGLAEQVARQCGAQHQTIWVTRHDFARETENLFAAMDQPSTDGVNSYFVSLAAKRAGLKVALSGLGGDELFGGYPSFNQIPRSARLLGGFDRFQRIGRAFRRISSPILRRLTSPKYAGLFEFGGRYAGAYLLRRGMFMPWETPVGQDLEVFRAGLERLQTIPRLTETVAGIRSPHARVSALEMNWYMRHQLLRDADWAGMAHSLEIRVPLVDVTLLRQLAPLLVSATPPTKRDLAVSPRSPLPSAVLNRPKTGFVVPVRDWLRNSSPPRTGRRIKGEVSNSHPTARGLRGWAVQVHGRFNWNESRDDVAPRQQPVIPAKGHRILCLVTDAFGGHGGIAKFNRDLLTALAADASTEEVVALPRLVSGAADRLRGKLRFLTRAAGGKTHYARAALRASVSNPPPSLIICGHLNLLPLACLARRLLKLRHASPPVVLVLHGIEAWQPPRSHLVRRLVERVDAVIAVSQFTRRRFFSWAHIASGLDFILPNSVDLDQFSPGPRNEELLKRYGLAGCPVLLTAARLSAAERYKGIDEVLAVLPELAREISNLSYLIVGDGDDRARLEQRSRELGLSDRVVFAGWVPDDLLVEHFRLADAFVMPGRGEGFGIVYLEAMACGIPVVASKADASGEVVRGVANAVVVDPADAEQLKHAIRQVLKLPRGPVPERVREFSLTHFNRRCGEIVAELETKLGQAGRRNILVFRIGQLGDTIVALPAMWAARRQFPGDRFTLLCDQHPAKSFVLAADLLRGAGLFDAFESYAVHDRSRNGITKSLGMIKLLRRLRRGRFDTLIYLAPSSRTPAQVARDRKFFSAAGIKEFIGMNGFLELPKKIPGQTLASTPAEADLLLTRLAADQIPVPDARRGSMELALGEAEDAEIAAWLAQLPKDGGRVWLGVGPGSKMPSKRWPEDRFREVVGKLIQRFNVWPVVFGGSEDAGVGARLLAAWGCGYHAAGILSLRGAAAAMSRCVLYLGNDTGTMHLAAAVHTPCVAIFSAREWPGMWFPYGAKQKVLRSQIDCEGCGLVECIERKNECLTRIGTAEVLAAAGDLLQSFRPMNGLVEQPVAAT